MAKPASMPAFFVGVFALMKEQRQKREMAFASCM